MTNFSPVNSQKGMPPWISRALTEKKVIGGYDFPAGQSGKRHTTYDFRQVRREKSHRGYRCSSWSPRERAVRPTVRPRLNGGRNRPVSHFHLKLRQVEPRISKEHNLKPDERKAQSGRALGPPFACILEPGGPEASFGPGMATVYIQLISHKEALWIDVLS